MSDPEPHPKKYNTARETRRDTDSIKNFVVRLYDVDFAIIEYMNEVLAPTVDQIPGTGPKIAVPIIYGSAERWASAKKHGYVRDQKGQLQLPLIMIRRNSLSRDDQFRTFNRYIRSSTVKSYSQKNKYDVFSQMQGAKPTSETYNVVFPDHVTLSYECIVWASFTEHLNEIVESFTFADNSYWGHKNKYKFRTNLDSINIANELTGDGERMIRASFNITVNAYLLPEEFANEVNTIKSFTPKRILMMTEIDTSLMAPNLNRYGEGNKLPKLGKDSAPKVSMLTEYQRLFDFLTLSNSYDAVYDSADATTVTSTVAGVAIADTPGGLGSVIADADKFQVFVNGVLVDNGAYVVSATGNGIQIVFTTATVGYTVDSGDDVTIRGKLVTR